MALNCLPMLPEHVPMQHEIRSHFTKQIQLVFNFNKLLPEEYFNTFETNKNNKSIIPMQFYRQTKVCIHHLQ